MADTEPINIMAGIRDLSKKGQTGQKMGITITGEDLFFDPNDKALAAAMAQTIVEQIREHLTTGKDPTGAPLPPLKAASVKRREVEAAQGKRSGLADDRFHDQTFRSNVLRHYSADYTAPRLGTFTPTENGFTRGVASGMLLKSFVAQPNRDGKGFTVYVAAKRGRPRPSETGHSPEPRSALENVFAGVPIWSQSAHNSPQMKAAMQAGADALLGKSKAAMKTKWLKLARKLGSELTSLAQNIEGLAEESE